MNISFISLQLSYLFFVDGDGILRWIEQRAPALARALGARAEHSGLRSPGIAAEGRGRSVRGIAWMGGALFGINTIYGALHQTDAWPFACYPTFSTVIGRQQRSLYVAVASPGTGEREADTGKAIAAFRSERYANLLYSVARERDQARRERKLEALVGLIRSLDTSIGPGDVIVIRSAIFSTDPDAGRAKLADDLLYAVEVR